jgi:murein DD-endopeptidase MepM/ murein hydrolase activator NlpD
MKPPFQVIVVLGDGSRVVRFSLPRWIAYATLGLLATAAISVIGLSGQHVLLEKQWVQLASLKRRVDDQRKLIDTFQERVSSVRTEIMNWKASHEKMWEAFGPDQGKQQKTGIGGASPDIYSATAGVKPQHPAEEIELLASTVAEEGPRLKELEHVVSRTGKMMSALPLRWPLRGHVRSEFGTRQSPWTGALEHHDGLDIGSPPGTPVKCPAPGRVMIATAGGDFGKHVLIDHGNGVRSLYGHLRKIDVKAGQKVEKGDVIGQVGSTGRSTGPHLHYELLVQGKPVNPRSFLWER